MIDPKQTAVPGEWYFGANCTVCGALTPVLHDPSKGKADIKLQGPGSKISTVCPNGHETLFPMEGLRRFEWKPKPGH